MKKLFLYIIATVIVVHIGGQMVYANTLLQNTEKETKTFSLVRLAEDRIEEIDDPNEDLYKSSTIPKVNFLPGPSEEAQKNSRALFGETILPRLAVMMIGFVGSLALVFLVIAGVRFTTNYGNEEAVTAAKNQAMYAVLGFLLALFSYAIVTILSNVQFVGDENHPPDEEENEDI